MAYFLVTNNTRLTTEVLSSFGKYFIKNINWLISTLFIQASISISDYNIKLVSLCYHLNILFEWIS